MKAARGSRVVVVPCFNEERRLDVPALLRLVDARTHLLLVDDGSTDRTKKLLESAAAQDPQRVRVLALADNRGKAEAVRAGLAAAVGEGEAAAVAYFDADLSTPVEEMQRLLAVLDERPEIDVVLGARVALLGRDIQRTAARHYLGRLFATVASTTLGVRVYDTQCGAKAFRNTPALAHAIAAPFTSRWAFDVELLARLLDELSPDAFVELPLQRWTDVGGSKLKARAMVKAGLDVLTIGAKRVTRRSRRTRR